jgi:hypothetical protein
MTGYRDRKADESYDKILNYRREFLIQVILACNAVAFLEDLRTVSFFCPDT